MYRQAMAILWAQWRTQRNVYPRTSLGALLFHFVFTVLWYGGWATAAVFVGMLAATPGDREAFTRMAPPGLLLVFVYWQFVPIMLVSTGASLDLKRLRVYPIPSGQLFAVEVLLRLTTGLEMLLILGGASIGLLLNPEFPVWAPLAFLPFILFNLFFAAGVRNLLARLLERKRIREIGIFLLVLGAALPQLLLLTGMPAGFREFLVTAMYGYWPWVSTADLVLGRPDPAALVSLLIWMALAYLFGRRQFERGLSFDVDVMRAAGAASDTSVRRFSERLFRLPSALLRDPLGALVEKEVRFWWRSPRFRLVFFMGFSFGLLIWLPLAFGRTDSNDTFFGANYLSFVSIYALMLLGEVCFWNSFGFDRAAAQLYFLAPVRFTTVLAAKNITAAVFVFLEITAIALICMLLRMPISLAKVSEAFAVALVLTIFFLGLGNLGSAYYPRAVNPGQSWRSTAPGRFQAFLLVLYPVISAPVALAFLARYAFDTDLAFYGVLAFDVMLGAVLYKVAMDSAAASVEAGREKFLAALAKGENPIAS